MARITTNTPTGEQLALDLYPTGDPDTFGVWTLDTRGGADVRAWIERRTKPGTSSVRQWRPVWLEGTRTARTATWYPTREAALHELLCAQARAEDTPAERLDRRDVSGLDLELTGGSTAAAQFVHRGGHLVGIVTRAGQSWLTETTAGDWHSGLYADRRRALVALAAHLSALEAIAETAPAVTEPEVLRSYSGATVPAAPLFDHFSAYVRSDEQTGEVQHLKILASNYSTGAEWTLVDVDWTEVDAVALGAETVTDPTPWLETFGYTLGEQGWSQIISIRQFTRGNYAADVIPPATLELPSPAEVYGAGLGKIADELAQLERSRETRIWERQRLARAAAAAGQSQSWIAERLGITRQAVAKLLAE